MAVSLQKWTQLAGKFRDFLLGAMGLACIGIAIYFSANDRLQTASLLFTAGLLLCAFSSLSRFESIKGLGVEAKLVALNDKVSEADQLLKHMREMAGLMADTSFQMIGKLGRWDAEIPKQEMLRTVEGLNKLLIALGEAGPEIERRLGPWHAHNVRELAQPIAGALQKFVQFQNQLLTDQTRQPASALLTPAEVSDKFERNAEFLRKTIDIWRADVERLPDAVTDLIRGSTNAPPEHLRWLQGQLDGTLEELRFYLKHKKFQNQAAWLARPYAWEIPLDFTSLKIPAIKY